MSAQSSKNKQASYLAMAVQAVKKLERQMLLALDDHNIREALHKAMELLTELRTSLLSPQNYYDLYMHATDVLRRLEAYIIEEDGRGGVSVEDLYESVQHAGTIVPRLYLLATVGSAYIKSKKAPCKDILFDLVELCRGVQHPMRGLFLRNYLSQMTRDKLPDAGSDFEGDGGDVKDAIEFVLQNFGEMNKLWVRMQHQGALRDLGKREKERRNLKQLVGTALVRLSEMEGVDMKMYSEVVLPKLLEVTVNCKDVIAQEYLMECIIQVFPDEFHLFTLETFLKSIQHLKSKVNVNSIIVSMMNRLSNFAKTNPGKIPSDINIFALFHKHSSQIIKAKTKMALEDILSLQAALLNFSSKCYPEKLEYADHVLGFTADVLSKSGTTDGLDANCTKIVKSLLTAPLETMQLAVLELKNYYPLMEFMGFHERRDLAIQMCEAVVKAGEPLDTVEKVVTFFKFIEPSLKDQKDAKFDESAAGMAKFAREQELVARVFHLVHNDDTDTQYELYLKVRNVFGKGGTKRIKYTIPPLVFGALDLVERVVYRMKEEKAQVQWKPKKLFVFIHQILVSAYTNHYPETAVRLFLKAAAVADAVGKESIAYEFMVQCFIAFEDEISDSKAQAKAIALITAALEQMSGFGEENWETLVGKCVQHSSKLLKKEDKARALVNCAHLFWPTSQGEEGKARRSDKKLLKLVQRSLKAANDCMKEQVELFVVILNKCLFFFEREVPTINLKYLQGLICLIEQHLPNLDESSDEDMRTKAYYQNTLNYVRSKKASATSEDSVYLGLDIENITAPPS
uniref:Vacuolar protein sorting-associated protein 35 n=1 Tax=Norrisiella sphaerica TaxID=552664 RepID=A0A7S2VUF8_9EUKA|mmetsp:Transcript_2311/g.3305  ORF Transcript_2311/g.3305 Transcript_2311/m.3305 type:complete len:797 (+) Transcript_2311:109-2499(+)|eukprot:CAMPEP_0184488752 /NCGR_PEP_ID=MMETSP0113_2-20130426/13203_1 /TAXON_ID=91329 /ORGANISM="Norrisiella sphaerica, Strain BC52" /LENGTH=796 /DNA_ID=CAMNT_0026871735 /DNA_START=37 /DNA_END=2427 /DNA_ORIENTATION=-